MTLIAMVSEAGTIEAVIGAIIFGFVLGVISERRERSRAIAASTGTVREALSAVPYFDAPKGFDYYGALAQTAVDVINEVRP